MNNKRLETIASLAEPGMITADIGTDHAFLPIMLVQKGIIPKAYACDLRKAPLESARQNIARAGLSDRIIPIQSDGFDRVPEDAQCAVLAGMGCHTAIGIYERAMDRLSSFQLLITEVNNCVPDFRQWLSDHHFTIRKEECVFDAGHWYEIIGWHTQNHDAYAKEDILLGPVNRQNRKDNFIVYCTCRYEKDQKLLSLRKEDPALAEKIQILKKYIQGKESTV
jgi:tRNA (adenine22-N1)-methyltransferase